MNTLATYSWQKWQACGIAVISWRHLFNYDWASAIRRGYFQDETTGRTALIQVQNTKQKNLLK
jgi:hypothetical protein